MSERQGEEVNINTLWQARAREWAAAHHVRMIRRGLGTVYGLAEGGTFTEPPPQPPAPIEATANEECFPWRPLRSEAAANIVRQYQAYAEGREAQQRQELQESVDRLFTPNPIWQWIEQREARRGQGQTATESRINDPAQEAHRALVQALARDIQQAWEQQFRQASTDALIFGTGVQQAPPIVEPSVGLTPETYAEALRTLDGTLTRIYNNGETQFIETLEETPHVAPELHRMPEPFKEEMKRFCFDLLAHPDCSSGMAQMVQDVLDQFYD